ncbi:MAG: LysM peptidoglycan-binding domain-containing protein [Actinomycetes bacterium]
MASSAASPIRLTRRGRLAVVVALTGGLLGGAVGVAGASFAGGGAPAAPQLRHITVRPGDTLWGIAVAASPGDDPRSMITRISELNDLDGALVPGQQLALPPR